MGETSVWLLYPSAVKMRRPRPLRVTFEVMPFLAPDPCLHEGQPACRDWLEILAVRVRMGEDDGVGLRVFLLSRGVTLGDFGDTRVLLPIQLCSVLSSWEL